MTETEQRGGKGRPTPKRSEARAARKKPVVTPRGGGKAATKADRAERAELRRKMREGLRTGDERYYPAVVAHPERALVRDVIDARTSFGWYAMAGWLVGVVLTLVPSAPVQILGSLVFPVVVIILIADAWTAARAVKRALARKWPDGTEQSRRSLVWYGIARNTQFRSSRRPPPRVEKGAQL